MKNGGIKGGIAVFILRYLKILLKGIYSISGFPCLYG